MRTTSLFIFGLLLAGSPAGAQQLASVSGVVYDSLHAAPLSGALVSIVGTSKSTITDNRGRFHFDSLAPKAYTFTAQHDAIDSAGFSGISTAARVDAPTTDVQLAIPSFSTMWRAACGARAESPDSGFVFGTVQSANGRSAADTRVDLSWVDVTADKTAGVKQRRYRLDTRTDARGSYGMCGIPKDATVEVAATGSAGMTGTIDVPPGDLRVRRINLVLGTSADSGKGIVAGRVVAVTGAPLRNARIILGTLPEARTDTAGRFLIRGAPVGTQQLEVSYIGLAPAAMPVNILRGDTTYVDVKLTTAVQLAAVKVSAIRQERLAREIADRKKLGYGYMRDSSEIRAVGTIGEVFRSFPSVQVVNTNRMSAASNYQIRFSDGHGNTCPAILFLDGNKVQPDMLNFVHPEDMAAVEVYPNRILVPAEFVQVGNPCGVVVMWTRAYFK
jgi:hypothetical protein